MAKKIIFLDVNGTIQGNPALRIRDVEAIRKLEQAGWDVRVWSGKEVPDDLKAWAKDAFYGIGKPLFNISKFREVGYDRIVVVDDEPMIIRAARRIKLEAVHASDFQSWLEAETR